MGQTHNSRLLIFDIETMANLMWSWDTYSKGGWRAIDTEVEWYPFSFGYMWYGDKRAQYKSLEHYKGYKPQVVRHKDGSITFRQPDIKPLLQDMWDLFDEADVVLGWNSRNFDVKKMNDQFLAYGFKPYSPFKQIDVMKEKRKLANSSGYSLKYTSEQWKTGYKLSNDGWPLWIACAEGDKKAQAEMARYCKRDVLQTLRNYEHIKPWITNHPNVNMLAHPVSHGTVYPGRPANCDVCGDTRMHQKTKKQLAGKGFKMQYNCYNCGHHQLGTKIIKPGDTF